MASANLKHASTKCWINPLAVEDSLLSLRQACPIRAEQIRQGYLLNLVPSNDLVLEKLVWPMRDAKSSYILGHFLSTIALAGFGCEMVTTFLFEIAYVDQDNHSYDSKLKDFVLKKAYEQPNNFKSWKWLRSFHLAIVSLRITPIRCV